MGSDRVSILGCPIDRLTLAETVERCVEIIDSRRPAQQMSINVAKLVALRKDDRLRAIANQCALLNADGQPIVWASHLLGDPLPERVSGVDLMNALLDVAVERGFRVFVLGARDDVLEAAVRRLIAHHPGLRITGHHHGYFTDDEVSAVRDVILVAQPDLLLVAMSSPRKEYFLADNAARLGVPLSIGVGGAIDIVAGITRRAPAWMQRWGLEWLFRVLQEPRRLGSRYITSNTQFLLLLAKELVTRRQSMSSV
jgi:N-acetylglucosaminyldiphosphoundecaprenol N-acetyl-beta-D-mannosaminyltransferase